MGNSLCKSQPPGRSRNPFEEFFSGCTEFCTCPSGISSHRNHHWKKQVIETRPPYLGAHTTSTKWHQATTLTSTQPLRQPHQLGVQGGKPPVPPPRKKRTLQKSRSYEDVLDIKFTKKAGFKDVFGDPGSLEPHQQQQATSSSHNHLYSLDNHETKSNSSSNSFGNKKTDKFFGENLSDSLSNEPYVPERGIMSRNSNNSGDKDELDMFVEKNVSKVAADKTDAEDRLSENLDKKAAFLMTMLDNYNDKSKKEEEDDDERYRGMIPVEEEIIVPKKKITRCICDETDHLLHHLRHNECKNHENTTKTKLEDDETELKKLVEKKDVATETPPVKPKRDLTLYRKSLEITDSMAKSLEERTPSPPLRRKKSLSTSKEELTEKPLSVATPVDSDKSVNDLMDQLVQHAFPHYMDIEDMPDGYIDGSDAVSEKISKLKERKISVNRKISTDSSHSNHSNLTSHEGSPGPNATGDNKLLLGCRDVTISPLSFSEIPVRVDSPRKSISPEKEVSVIVEDEPKFEKASSPAQEASRPEVASNVRFVDPPEKKDPIRLQDDGVNMLEELIRHQHFNTTEDVINEIYKNQTNIVYEFQRFLEDELSKEENAGKLLAEDKLKPLPIEVPDELIESQSIDLVSNSTESETSSEASTIKNLSDNDSDILPSQFRRTSVDDLDNWFPQISDTNFDLVSSDSDNASTVRALSPSDPEDDDRIVELVRNNHLTRAKMEDKRLQDRRESIEDVDIWFTQHLDLPNVNLSQSMVNEDAKKADFLTYDGAKLYPFGQPRERHMSLTDEFFTKQDNQEKQKLAKDVKRSNSESH